MNVIEIQHIAKSFGATQAVQDVSFDVQQGEIFGLLGPNGSGKTTSIRILLDIFKADRGQVTVLGGEMTEAKKNRVGYMPEERGMYQDIPLERCLLYLASLKDVSPLQARPYLEELLERFDLAAHRRKKVKELSKGMQQKAQIIATILHKPELLILDEPFSGLDPVNTQMVIDLMRGLSQQGATVLMSTHQMHQVEQLCDRLVLIDHGRNVLYGRLLEIQRQFSGHAVRVQVVGELPALPGVERIDIDNHSRLLHLEQGATPQQVLQALVAQGCVVEQFEIALPGLDEIFIRAVEKQE